MERCSGSSEETRFVNGRRSRTCHGFCNYISPAQPYSTDSGSLFNAGKFLIAMVGLPATSKTLLSVAITRYARWSGVRIESFHITKYEAMVAGDGEFHNDSESKGDITLNGEGTFRERVLKAVTDDMARFFQGLQGSDCNI